MAELTRPPRVPQRHGRAWPGHPHQHRAARDGRVEPGHDER